jgi:hypothetical protein
MQTDKHTHKSVKFVKVGGKLKILAAKNTKRNKDKNNSRLL